MRYAALFAVLALTACAPLETYYKPGSTVQQLAAETLECEVRALRDAPVAERIRQSAPIFVPARKTCNSSGKCTTTNAYWIPGELYTVDINADLRQRVETQCMAGKGFLPAQIPACPRSIKAEGQTEILPTLTDQSCVIRNSDGTFLIVNKG